MQYYMYHITIMGPEVTECNNFNLKPFNLISTDQMPNIYWHYERYEDDWDIVPSINLRVAKKQKGAERMPL